MNYLALSQEVSYALRHAPEEYGLVLDEEGFADIGQLVDAINSRSDYGRLVSQDDLEHMVLSAKKHRHEIADGRIRALYGHSTAQRITKEPALPPDILYHGTGEDSVAAILVDGLKPMGRQYVHLATSVDMASVVAARHGTSPVILRIDAGRAVRDGIAFYRGGEDVWLADAIPPMYLHVLNEGR